MDYLFRSWIEAIHVRPGSLRIPEHCPQTRPYNLLAEQLAAPRGARENEMEAETIVLAIVAAVFGPLFVIAILEALGL